jgi:membrane protease YdiL (CAAX protease family)
MIAVRDVTERSAQSDPRSTDHQGCRATEPRLPPERTPVASPLVVDPENRRAHHPVRSAIRPSVAPNPIDVNTAVITFVFAWLAAQVLSSVVVGVLGGGSSISDTSIGVIAAALIAAWTAYLAGLWVASQRGGSGDPVEDYGITFAPIDAAGVGIGVLAQLVLIELVYLPLEALWPATFTDDRLQENARDLVDQATGASALVLVVLIVVGAPVVEELFYRGLLQRSLAARFNDSLVVVGVAALFALVHFRPVEFPGLFAFGLVVGICALLTGRLGMAIVTHMAFNATGLVLAWS